jgi:uncharacterized protein (TIGR03118 family)
MHRFTLRSLLAAAILCLGLTAAAPVAAAPPGATYAVTNLVSDVPGLAQITDPNLVNAWGLARSGTSPWWVADNETNVSTLYNTTTNQPPAIVPLVVSVPNHPTGVVFAGITGQFLIQTAADPTLSRASFVFDTEEGNILAWRGGPTAFVPAAFTPVPGASYKGLAIAQPTPGNPVLYAADFHNARVEVFNGAWANVTANYPFRDPDLQAGYAPFNIQVIGDTVYVTYAQQDADAADEVAGMSRGFVDAYDLNGNFVSRVATRGQLDAPWGVALAPASFGRYAGDLLVGNFGNGQINAYSNASGEWEYAGALRDTAGQKLAIDGLWALVFGSASANGNPDTLFFTAGPHDESHGLFGTITPS